VIEMFPSRSPILSEQLAQLYRCETFAVLVVDPATGEIDAHGPYDGLAATIRADGLRNELDADGLSDVLVGVTRLHLTEPIPTEPILTEPILPDPKSSGAA
jgi:hypothetical protein